ncbi:MAG: flagellar assembly protein FliX [Pseudomonadota bacterium]
MRIDGPNGTNGVGAGKRTRKSGPSAAFEVDSDAGSGRASGVPGVSVAAGLGGVDAILALQAVEDPFERRRQAIRNGHDLLDALDDLKLAVLEGRLGSSTLGRLEMLLDQRAEIADDPGLVEVLDAIALRVQVELAKRSQRDAA